MTCPAVQGRLAPEPTVTYREQTHCMGERSLAGGGFPPERVAIPPRHFIPMTLPVPRTSFGGPYPALGEKPFAKGTKFAPWREKLAMATPSSLSLP